MQNENYLRLALIVLALCVLCALLYQIAQQRQRQVKQAIGFTATRFAALETKAS